MAGRGEEAYLLDAIHRELAKAKCADGRAFRSSGDGARAEVPGRGVDGDAVLVKLSWSCQSCAGQGAA